MRPQAPDAEKAVIAAILATRGEVFTEIDFLKPEHFATDENSLVFDLARTIWEAGGSPDSVIIAEALRDNGVPGADVLIQDYTTDDASGTRDYGLIVKGKWRSREIIRLADDASRSASTDDPDSVLDTLE